MDTWKTVALVVAGVILLWLLAPQRSSEVIPGEEVVEITYMAPGGPIGGAMDDVVRAFEQESLEAHRQDPSRPIYRVISGQHGARDQVADPTRFLISVAGGMPPDVIYFDRFAVAEWASRGAFTPLDGYIEQDLAAGHPDAVVPDRFYRTVWDEANYNGRPYGIPNGVDDRALFYNKDMFIRAGLKDAEGNATPPRNWDELREFSRKLTLYDETRTLGNGKHPIRVLGFAPNFGNSWFYMFAFMNGARFISEDGTRCTMAEPRSVEALQYMVDIYNDAGGYEDVMAFQAGFQGGALDPFITGKIAMKIDGYWVIDGLNRWGRDVNWGCAAPPVSQRMMDQGIETVTWNGGWSYAIPINAKHKEAAWEFIRFMVSDRAWDLLLLAQKETSEAEGRIFIPQLVPIKDVNERYIQQYVLENEMLSQKVKDAVITCAAILEDARFRPITPVGQLLWNKHIEAMERACYGDFTSEKALEMAQADVQRALDRVLTPSQGALINWNYFFLFYAILVIVLIAGAYLWDTSVGFRRQILRTFTRKKKDVGVGDVVEGSRGGYFRQQWWAGFTFVSPWVIGFIIFGGGPMLFSILMSFCDYDVINPARFIGMENYFRMFREDEIIPKSIANTLFMVLGVPLGMAASLSLALLLNMQIRGISVWRTIFYLPAIVPSVASFILWIWMFNPEGGIFNQVLETLGVQDTPNWLVDKNWSKPSLIIMGLWSAGGGMLIWLAGLKGISEQYYEAAAIDGASEWQQFRHITVPMLTPYIFFNLVMGFIGVFQIFDAAFIMTQGGPVNSTLFYVYHLFNHAFRYGNMGYASAMAWFLFLIIMILTVVQLKLARHWVHYESE